MEIGPRGEYIVPSSWRIGLANFIERNTCGGRTGAGETAATAAASDLEAKGDLFGSGASLYALVPASGPLMGLVRQGMANVGRSPTPPLTPPLGEECNDDEGSIPLITSLGNVEGWKLPY